MRRKLIHQKRHVRRKYQKGGFLNRYDFAYAGRDTINQAFKNLDKTVPPLNKRLSTELNKILEKRINQIIRQGGAGLTQIAPELLRKAIKERLPNTVSSFRKCRQKKANRSNTITKKRI